MITAKYPQTTKNRIKKQIKDSVLSATWDALVKPDIFEDQSFTLTESPDLKAVKVLNFIVFNEAGRIVPGTLSEPFLQVVEHHGAEIGGSKLYSDEAAVESFSGIWADVENISVVERKRLELDSRQAYEIIASAKQSKTGADMVLYQVVVSRPASTLFIQASVQSTKAKEYLEQFRQISYSLKFKKSQNET